MGFTGREGGFTEGEWGRTGRGPGVVELEGIDCMGKLTSRGGGRFEAKFTSVREEGFRGEGRTGRGGGSEDEGGRVTV